MFSFDHATNVMYTCDAFGSHYCTDDPWDTDVKAVMPHYRFYYDCLMKPNARSVSAALRKVRASTSVRSPSQLFTCILLTVF